MRQASIPAFAGLRRSFASTNADPSQSEAVRPAGQGSEHFWRPSEPAPALLIKLDTLRTDTHDPCFSGQLTDAPLDQTSASILKNVFVSEVIPRLAVVAIAPQTEASAASSRAAALAELLFAPDQTAALDLIEEFCGEAGAGASLIEKLLEPAARRLGDLWSEDLCSELDVTLGLCRLQAAARLLPTETMRRLPSLLPHPTVLVAPEPGELHHFGAALDTLMLRNAGWSPQCEYPRSDDALDALLASTWFDVLDLSLSAAFRREHRLAQVTQTIARARSVSRNPALVVIVGGRIFREEQSAATDVGADRAMTTSLTVKRTILNTLQATATAVMQLTATPS